MGKMKQLWVEMEERKREMEYEVEMKRTSYVLVVVEADNPEDAEMRAWEQLENSCNHELGFWDIEYVKELGAAQGETE